MTLNKINTLIYKIFRTFPAFYTVIITPNPFRGRYCRGRIGTFIGGKIFIETIIFDRRRIMYITPASHMPFTDVPGSIARILKGTRHRRKFVIQIITLFTSFVTCFIIEESINSYLKWEKPCCQPATGRRTNRSRRIILIEQYSVLCQFINIGCRNKLASITTNITYAHIININNNYIRRSFCLHTHKRK